MIDLSSATGDDAAAAALASGDFWSRLDGVRLLNDSAQSAEQLARLHRTGAVDLTALDTGPISSLPGHKRYVAVKLLTSAIGRLAARPDEILTIVDRLVAELTDDADHLREGVRLWCASHEAEALVLVDQARQGDTQARRFLTPILIGSGRLETIRDLARSSDPALVESALRALSRTAHAEGETAATTDLLLEIAQTRPADTLRALVVTALFEAVVARQGERLDSLLNVLDALLEDAEPDTRYALAYGLFALQSPMSAAAVARVRPLLSSVTSSEAGALELIDHILGAWVQAGCQDVAADMVFAFASREADPVALERFDGFFDTVMDTRGARPGSWVIDWLLRGDNAVSQQLSHVFQKRDRSGKPIQADLPAGLADEDVYFLCRQAIGWFLLEEVAAASIVVVALRTASEALAPALIDLLVDPLLLNYDGELVAYLDGLPLDDPAAERIAEARAIATAYRDGLDGDWVSELTPSQSRLQLAHNQRLDAMHKTQREGRKASIFADLVTSQHILYTDRVTTYWVKPDGTFDASESQLQSFSISYELPRQDVLDPVGLSMRHHDLCYGRRSKR